MVRIVFFSDRKKLENKYCEWLKRSKTAKDCAFNVITFLSGLLDENKVKEFLEKFKKVSGEAVLMEEFKEKLLQEEVDRLNKALRKIDSINLIDNCTSLVTRKNNQKKLNKAYSLIVDTKMNLEKYIEQMEE